ncbi:MAG: cytochrome C [Myxococcales bacterium]|nr:MAG: cytochrome C [Myxococcales bacterium]
MYDGKKVIVGLVVFLAFALFPVWYNLAAGTSGYMPELKKPEGYTKCVESTPYMRAFHMDLLNQWRDEFVRESDRYHSAPDGTRYWKSLSGTCMKCHANKDTFCDRCHNYVGVTPYCWDCHVQPQGVK